MKNLLFLACALAIACFCIIGISNSNHGRYQIYMHPQFRADEYLLDTKTGQVWHVVKAKDDHLLWEEMEKVYLPPFNMTEEEK